METNYYARSGTGWHSGRLTREAAIAAADKHSADWRASGAPRHVEAVVYYQGQAEPIYRTAAQSQAAG